MNIEIQEQILQFQNSQLVAWKAQDKSLIPAYLNVEELPFIRTQNVYSFGEIFVLRHYYENGGWKGVLNYSLGSHRSRSPIRRHGKEMVDKLVPTEKLENYRRLRGTKQETNRGAGEPDLFLYRDTGEYMFIEVKKGKDRIRPIQLKCMAIIKRTIDCPVGIVYLQEEHQVYKPKTYVLDLDLFEGYLKKV
jgi:hypothetical protein